MGRAKRERIARIRAGLEQPISALRNPEKIRKQEEQYSVKLITTKCKDITNLTEIKVCNQISAMLGNPLVPKHIVKDKLKEGMAKVVDKLMKAGESKEFIRSFYWNITQFRDLWTQLEYTEDDWVNIVNR